MRYVKFFILNVVVFGTLFFLISLLFPSKNQFAKSINLPVSKDLAERALLNTGNWKQWNLLLAPASPVKRITTDTSGLPFESKGKLFAFYITASDSLSATLNCVYTEQLNWYNPVKKYAAMVNNKSTAWLLDTSLVKFRNMLEANGGN